MELDDLPDGGDDGDVLDLDALTASTFEPMREASRMATSHTDAVIKAADPFRRYSTMQTIAPVLSSLRFDTVPIVSSTAAFATLAGTSALGKAFEGLKMPKVLDYESLVPSITKYVAPDWLAMLPSVSSMLGDMLPVSPVSEMMADLVGTVMAPSRQAVLDMVRPAVSTLDFAAMAGLDAKSFGFTSFSSMLSATDMDWLVFGVGISGWSDAMVRGLATVDPLGDVYRDLEEGSREIEEMLSPRIPDRFVSYASPGVEEAYVPIPAPDPVVEQTDRERIVVHVEVPSSRGLDRANLVVAAWAAAASTASVYLAWLALEVAQRP